MTPAHPQQRSFSKDCEITQQSCREKKLRRQSPKDHVLAVSDDNGQILEHYAYSAYGEVEIYSPSGSKRSTSGIDNEVLWNSRRYDADTGLYYYKYRHYSPQLGKWPARDPIEEKGGVNLYAFVGNDPVDHFDMLGLEETSLCDCLKFDVARVGGTFSGGDNGTHSILEHVEIPVKLDTWLLDPIVYFAIYNTWKKNEKNADCECFKKRDKKKNDLDVKVTIRGNVKVNTTMAVGSPYKYSAGLTDAGFNLIKLKNNYQSFPNLAPHVGANIKVTVKFGKKECFSQQWRIVWKKKIAE